MISSEKLKQSRYRYYAEEGVRFILVIRSHQKALEIINLLVHSPR